MKKILLCSPREKWKPFLESIVSGFHKLYECEYEFKLINGRLPNECDDYDLAITVAWNQNYEGKKLLTKFNSMKKDMIFLSDGCFFYNKKTTSELLNYPFAVFVNGTQSSPVSDKHYRTDLPNDRVKLFYPESKLIKWRPKGSFIIITHQSGSDFRGNSKCKFYNDIVDKCSKLDRNIIFRLHPNASKSTFLEKKKQYASYSRVLVQRSEHDREMSKVLKGAHCLITYGGKSPAKAIIGGIPSLTYDITIAEMVAERDFNKIENPRMPDREPWMNWLSYNHWTGNEMSNNLPWKFMLNNGYFEV